MAISSEDQDLIELGLPFRLDFDSVGDALNVARELQSKGHLFRGQSNAEWSVTSSAERLTDEKFEEARTKISRFLEWARKTAELKDIPEDSLFAIAQHYGLPTFFIDFTDDPEVAAFFACHTTNPPQAAQRAAIACLNPRKFEEFWTIAGPTILANYPEAHPPEIIRIDVQNLWRLQAQRGCFLWSEIIELESISRFARLTFPCEPNNPALLPEERIYPRNESALEQLLKGFFMNEQMREGNARVMTAGFKLIPLEGKIPGRDAVLWYPAGIESTPDWAEAAKWRSIPNEPADKALPAKPLRLPWSGALKPVADAALAILTPKFISDNREMGLFFEVSKEIDSTAPRLQACIRRLWNGMRILPYDEMEIRQAIENTIAAFLSARRTADGVAIRLADPLPGTFRQYVEFTRNAEARGDYSRGYVANESLIRAHSPAFLEAASAHLGGTKVEAFTLLQLPARPWERFAFGGLRRLMVEELVPTQMVLRGDDPTPNALNKMIYFSPADLKVFGLA